MKKILPIANGVALVITIIINILSVTGNFDGNTMASISAKYPTLFTPAGYAFGIWIIIYLGLLSFVVYHIIGLFRRAESGTATESAATPRTATESAATVRQIGWWFVLSCVANCCWVLAWLYGWTGLSVLIMLGLLFCLLKIILRTDMELTDPPLRIIASVWWPFCLYSGWVTSALLTNISVWLKKTGWNEFESHETCWAIAMMLLAGIIYLFMTWRRNMREYAIVGAWALIAIAIADHDRSPAASITAYAVAAVLLISSSVHSYRNRAFSPWRKRS
jgi:hypothetical protein